MKKIVGALVLFVLILSLSGVMADTGNLEFQVDITVDTTISIPALCENGGSVAGVLEFSPGIEGIDTAGARPDDGCGDASTWGDYNATNDGNVQIDLSFKLNDSAPTGVTIAVGNQSAHDAIKYVALSTTDSNPTWAQDIPATGSDTVQIWQRVGADETASGGQTFFRQIIITSAQG
jgi:hypothetical protein